MSRSAAARGSATDVSASIAAATTETHVSVASRTCSCSAGSKIALAWISPHTVEVSRSDSSSSASSVARTPGGAARAARSFAWSSVARTRPLREPK